jgi:hypothetical protein
VIGANVVMRHGISRSLKPGDELTENRMVSKPGHIFHADDIGLRGGDEPRKLLEELPFFLGVALICFSVAACIQGEGSARSTADQNAVVAFCGVKKPRHV